MLKGLGRLSALVFLGAFCALAFLPSCSNHDRQADEAVEIADKLDQVAANLEEYGTITLSTPLLSLPDTPLFDLNRSTQQYFTDALQQTQGGASVFDEVAQRFAGAASVRYDPAAQGAFNSQLQQFQAFQARTAQMRATLDYASQQQLTSSLLSAAQITDPSQRAAAIAHAEQAYAAGIAPTTTVSYPTGGTPPPLPTDSSGAPTFQPVQNYLSLLGGPTTNPPTISNRQAIFTAAGDKAVEQIFTMLGKANASQFRDRLVVYGVAMVAVNPGWRTKTDFAADIGVLNQYGFCQARPEVVELVKHDARNVAPWIRSHLRHDTNLIGKVLTRELVPLPAETIQKARQLGPDVYFLLAESGRPTDTFWKKSDTGYEEYDDPEAKRHSQLTDIPNVAAIAPMTETQVLDLANSQQSSAQVSLQMAFVLSLAGLPAQAQAFYDYAHSHELDVKTRTALVPVNVYSNLAGMFGVQVGPRLQAIEHPKEGDEAENVLERQSFPILLVMGLDKDDIRPRIAIHCDPSGRITDVQVIETQLFLRASPRWVLVEPSAIGQHVFHLSPSLFKHWEHRRAENDLLGDIVAIKDAKTKLKSLMDDASIDPLLFWHIRVRAKQLEYLTSGGYNSEPFPLKLFLDEPGGPPCVRSVFPTDVPLVATGTALKPLVALHPGTTNEVDVTLIGDRLDALDLHAPNIEVLAGPVTVPGDATVTPHGHTLSVPLTFGAEGDVVLKFKVDPERQRIGDPDSVVVKGLRGLLPPSVTTVEPSTVAFVKSTTPTAPTPATLLLVGQRLDLLLRSSKEITVTGSGAKVTGDASLINSAAVTVPVAVSDSGPFTLRLHVDPTRKRLGDPEYVISPVFSGSAMDVTTAVALTRVYPQTIYLKRGSSVVPLGPRATALDVELVFGGNKLNQISLLRADFQILGPNGIAWVVSDARLDAGLLVVPIRVALPGTFNLVVKSNAAAPTDPPVLSPVIVVHQGETEEVRVEQTESGRPTTLRIVTLSGGASEQGVKIVESLLRKDGPCCCWFWEWGHVVPLALGCLAMLGVIAWIVRSERAWSRSFRHGRWRGPVTRETSVPAPASIQVDVSGTPSPMSATANIKAARRELGRWFSTTGLLLALVFASAAADVSWVVAVDVLGHGAPHLVGGTFLVSLVIALVTLRLRYVRRVRSLSRALARAFRAESHREPPPPGAE